MPEQLGVREEGGVAWLTFDNVPRRNALTMAMCRSIMAELERIAADPALHVVVLRGAGEEAFMSGADISEQDDPESARTITALYAALGATAKPVIAMVHGFCLGGGLATALEADLRVAAEGSLFGIPAARLGIGYPFDGVQRLVGLVGPAVAADILYTGRRMPAQDALRVGLVQELLPRDGLEARVAGPPLKAGGAVAGAVLDVAAALLGHGQVEQLAVAADAIPDPVHGRVEGRGGEVVVARVDHRVVDGRADVVALARGLVDRAVGGLECAIGRVVDRGADYEQEQGADHQRDEDADEAAGADEEHWGLTSVGDVVAVATTTLRPASRHGIGNGPRSTP